MKNKAKTPVILLGILLTLLLMNGCRTSRVSSSSSPIKIEGLVKWTVTFKKEITTEQKARALVALDKAILNDLGKQGFLIATIKFTHTDLNLPGVVAVSITVDVEGTSSMPGVSTVKPPRPLPKKDLQLPADLEDLVAEITELNAIER